MRGTQKTRKTGHYTIEERLGDSVFLGNNTGCGDAERQLRATGLFPVCIALPRNESQHFRPAGTRVALPGTNCRSSRFESGLQDFFRVLHLFAKR